MEFVKTKRFAEATQLNDEEMQAALARKNRWLKFKNFMKGLAGFGLGAAALYGGAKWYQNGGRGFVQNVMDRGADFTSKVGDATVDTAKGVVNDTVNEVNRGLNQWAANRVGVQQGTGATSVPTEVNPPQNTQVPAPNPVAQNEQVNTTIDQTNQEAESTLNKLNQQFDRSVSQANLHNQTGWSQNSQANDAVNEVAELPEEVIEDKVGGGSKVDPQVLNKANSIYMSAMNSSDINQLNSAINQLSSLGSNPEIQNIINNLQMKVNMISQSNSQVENQINDYNSQLAKYQGNNNDYFKLVNAGVSPSKYGIYPMTSPDKPNIPKNVSKLYYQNNKNGVKMANSNKYLNDAMNDYVNNISNMNKYLR